MKKNILLPLLFLLIGWQIIPAQRKRNTPTNNAITQKLFNPKENGYKLVWQDDFNGTKLDTT